MTRVKATGINQKGIGPQAMTSEKRQAFLEDTSTIILKNRTIEHLRELSFDMPHSSQVKQGIITYDDLILTIIRFYRKKKNLWDPILNEDDD